MNDNTVQPETSPMDQKFDIAAVNEPHRDHAHLPGRDRQIVPIRMLLQQTKSSRETTAVIDGGARRKAASFDDRFPGQSLSFISVSEPSF
jgi:hypothetical protein